MRVRDPAGSVTSVSSSSLILKRRWASRHSSPSASSPGLPPRLERGARGIVDLLQSAAGRSVFPALQRCLGEEASTPLLFPLLLRFHFNSSQNCFFFYHHQFGLHFCRFLCVVMEKVYHEENACTGNDAASCHVERRRIWACGVRHVTWERQRWLLITTTNKCPFSNLMFTYPKCFHRSVSIRNKTPKGVHARCFCARTHTSTCTPAAWRAKRRSALDWSWVDEWTPKRDGALNMRV